ncbi:MAG TPA: 6-bladed beta-propeller [Verrucomicrobiae bacterium]|jgi:DNA-binding beta-propeller fold protein YncE
MMNRLAQIGIAAFALFSTAALASELKYTITPDFFEANPGGKPIGPCHGGTVIDAAGNIYITTNTKRGVLVFSPEGKFIRAFGPPRIHGLQLSTEDGVEYIYGARPDDHEVLKLKLDGTIEWTIHYPTDAGIYTNADGFKPCAVTVGPDGSIFVADGYGANYVLKFDRDRKFIKAFGGKGEAEGKFNTCHGIALDTRQGKPLLFICDRNNNRVEYWDLDGNFIKTIRSDLRMPAAVSIRGEYAVIPELQGRVTVLDKDGNIAAQAGDNPNPKQRANFGLPPDQWTVGICNSPHGATMDKDGNLIVTEWSQFGHLHKFSKSE